LRGRYWKGYKGITFHGSVCIDVVALESGHRIGGPGQREGCDGRVFGVMRDSEKSFRGKPESGFLVISPWDIAYCIAIPIEGNDSKGPLVPLPLHFSQLITRFLGVVSRANCLTLSALLSIANWYLLPSQLRSVGIYNASCFLISCLMSVPSIPCEAKQASHTPVPFPCSSTRSNPRVPVYAILFPFWFFFGTSFTFQSIKWVVVSIYAVESYTAKYVVS
jgi:hypothetical protein